MLLARTKVRRFSTLSIRLNQTKPNYSKTLQLPKTNYGARIPKGELRQQLIKQTSQDLYSWQQENKTSEKNGKFILHDGPPYANGDLHLGHALNKICKDIINRFQLIYYNKLIDYRPGWDCHGLPIEMKVETTDPEKHKNRSAREIRQACRDLANYMIDRQRIQFKDFAIMADFEKPYITMDHGYEINQLKVFRKLVENGLLSQQLKPVWWGCDTQTALAEAELEYNDNHKSVAIHAKFPVVSDELYEYIESSFGKSIKKGDLKLLIWTSTPWTMPANKAICVNRHSAYTLIQNSGGSEYLVVGKLLVDDILKLNDQYRIVDPQIEIPGDKVAGNLYINPAAKDNQTRPVLHGDHVTETAGTGLVHNAPAHGREDYLVAKKYELSLDSVVDNTGRYVNGKLARGFESLGNSKVTDIKTNLICAQILADNDMLFHLNKKFTHSYPYDWRSKTPVIQRATPQWFVNVETIKPHAIEALSKVKFYPEKGSNRLTLFVENRSEWCISRQRVWGVPLPIIYNKKTDEPVMNLEIIDHLIEKLNEFGTDEWFVPEEDISRWLPSESYNGADYYKGQDTMDVWFDSGTSWNTLRPTMEECADAEEPLADVYLEGSDQHRGWFQSSILNKVIYSGKSGETYSPVAPFKNVITHGFITDGKGQKMSKSKGNVFSPTEAIEGCKKPMTPYLGPDGLRLWVASSNYKQDVNFSPEVLNRVSEVGKKYRVTFKYLLGNLNNFDQAVDYSQLNDLDKYTLHTLYQLQQQCIEFYKDYNFPRVISSINLHVNTTLSSIYFDISKDCLYTDKANSPRRKGVQTVLNEIFKTYVGLLAPIQPLLTQEVWSEYVKIGNNTASASSPFQLGDWSKAFALSESYINEGLAEEFEDFLEFRSDVYKLAQSSGAKNKLEYKLVIETNKDTKMFEFLKRNESYLDDLFLFSKVEVVDKQHGPTDIEANWKENVVFSIEKSSDCKCPRCWKFNSKQEDHLCPKCDDVVN
ncbi:ISM1 [[Candida] subhashii]|uniref:Isoleucyl-tRNA synthetase n=1 Tax=[Candida] subhashii TaxID=561895 RepID=A0A8J5QGA8_9ASCO|nr:ISM1 [[Candida] subhashii]KAG7662517.1 ISM1 [[Candida] subhashii]